MDLKLPMMTVWLAPNKPYVRATMTADVWEFVWPDASGNGNDAVQLLRPADVAKIIAERAELLERVRGLEQRARSNRIANALERIADKLDLALIEPDLRCVACSGTGRTTLEDDEGRIHGVVACRACNGSGGKLIDPKTGKPFEAPPTEAPPTEAPPTEATEAREQ